MRAIEGESYSYNPFDFDERLRFDAATLTKIKISSGTLEYGMPHMKKIPCLLALALFGASLQSYRSNAAKSDPGAQSAAQNQTSPKGGSQQANETVVPAPPKFSENFFGTIGRHIVSMKLKRDGDDLSGSYS